MLSATEAAAIRDDPASTPAQRRWWHTQLLRYPEWCAALNRATRHTLMAFPRNRQTWEVRGLGPRACPRPLVRAGQD